MFSFLKELKEAIQEGFEEGRAELAAEKEAEEAKAELERATYERLSKELPSIENIALALSCPYREILTDGSNLRLFTFGNLEEKEIESFKSILYRDFQINDEETVRNALTETDSLFSISSHASTVFKPALLLYILTSSAELDFISFADYKTVAMECIRKLTNNKAITSWEDFANFFMKEECINNILGRKFLQRGIDRLLTEEHSPWVIFPWPKVVETMDLTND